jgi:hypothetical protein
VAVAALFILLFIILSITVTLLFLGTHKNNQVSALLQTRLTFNLSWFIFISVLVLELAAGYYFNYLNGMVMGDAASRVANAFFVLYIQPPHLASIGFVWNPLPSLLELPFLLFLPLFKPLATSALAGVIVTSLFAAGTAVLIYRNCNHFNLPTWVALIITGLYVFNPFIFVYGFNGMSEAMFIFFLVLATTQLVQWISDEKPVYLFWVGVALALAFLIRYEAIAFAAAVFFVVCFLMLKKRRQSGEIKSIRNYFEGTIIVIFVPLVSCITLWILANWIFMGDPLYFLTSEYSNEAYTETSLGEDILSLQWNIPGILLYALKMSIYFIPLMVVILIIRFLNKKLLQWETLMFLVLVLGITAFESFMLLRGASYGWLRFFVYSLPVAVAWMPYELEKMKENKPLFKKVAAACCCLALVVSSVSIGITLKNPEIAREEYSTYFMESGSDLDLQVEIAAYINEHYDEMVFLMDSYHTWYVILNMDSTDKVITTCSYTFKEAIEDPEEFDVQYILLVDPEIGVADAINNYYPGLYENGAEWCTLEKDFGDYRLYKVDIIPAIE